MYKHAEHHGQLWLLVKCLPINRSIEGQRRFSCTAVFILCHLIKIPRLWTSFSGMPWRLQPLQPFHRTVSRCPSSRMDYSTSYEAEISPFYVCASIYMAFEHPLFPLIVDSLFFHSCLAPLVGFFRMSDFPQYTSKSRLRVSMILAKKANPTRSEARVKN